MGNAPQKPEQKDQDKGTNKGGCGSHGCGCGH